MSLCIKIKDAVPYTNALQSSNEEYFKVLLLKITIYIHKWNLDIMINVKIQSWNSACLMFLFSFNI